MGITRRLFLRAGTIVGIAAVTPFAGNKAFGQKIGSPQTGNSKDSTFINTDILSFVEASDFEEQVGASFLVRTDALNTQTLELVQVKVKRDTERLYAFSLLFSSPSGAEFPQASYLFEHEKIGVFPLFVVPVKTPKGMRYEAVISRLRGPALKGATPKGSK